MQLTALSLALTRTEQVRSGLWTPAVLFASGEQGAWYDPSDLSTLFQDSAGTIPVTAAGQEVGRMLDKSGRGNHVTQATTSLKPILRQDGGGRYYLEFDGVDDFLNASSNSQIVGPEIGAFYGVVHRGSVSAVGATSKYKFGNFSSTVLRFTSLAMRDYEFASQVSTGTRSVFGFRFDAGFDVEAYKNGVSVGTATHTADSPNGDSPLWIGQVASGADRFYGDLYGLVIRKATFAAGEVTSLMNYLNTKTGAY